MKRKPRHKHDIVGRIGKKDAKWYEGGRSPINFLTYGLVAFDGFQCVECGAEFKAKFKKQA